MCRPPALSARADELQSAFPALTRPQVKVLAQYSLGMALAGRSGLSCVAAALAAWVGQAVGTVRERLRDWYCGAADKSGGGGGGTSKRRELDVDACFAPLLSWVLRVWAGDEMALALDATTLGERRLPVGRAAEVSTRASRAEDDPGLTRWPDGGYPLQTFRVRTARVSHTTG